MEQGKIENVKAWRRVAALLQETVGEDEATDRDVQHELLRYAAELDHEVLVRMWAMLSYPMVDD